MKAFLWLVAVFLAALLLRLYGTSGLTPTLAETSVGVFGKTALTGDITPWRLAAAAASALAAVALAAAFLRHGSLVVGSAAALLAILDPLGAAAGREAAPGALLALVSSLLVLAVLRLVRGRLVLVAVAVAGAAGIVLAAASDWNELATLPRDAVFGAWRPYLGDTVGLFATLIHHTGYVLAPLALAGMASPRGRIVALLTVCSAVLVSLTAGGLPARLSTLAGVSPLLVAGALLVIERVAAADREQGRRPLAALGLVGLILAVNLPVLVSDLCDGLRFPWRAALWQLDQIEELGAPILSTTPEVVAMLTDRAVTPLPPTIEGIEDCLDTGRAVAILLPVEGGALFASPDPTLLAAIEKLKVADFETRQRRFDLYRFEVWCFVFR